MTEDDEFYELDELENFARDLDFPTERPDSNTLSVELSAGLFLEFRNYQDSFDLALGFRDSEWHVHGALYVNTGSDTLSEFDEFEVLLGFKDGDLLVVEEQSQNPFAGRWIIHKNDRPELKHLQRGEEIRIYSPIFRKQGPPQEL